MPILLAYGIGNCSCVSSPELPATSRQIFFYTCTRQGSSPCLGKGFKIFNFRDYAANMLVHAEERGGDGCKDQLRGLGEWRSDKQATKCDVILHSCVNSL